MALASNRELLGKRCSFLTHPQYEASIMEAPSRYIRVKLLQRVGKPSGFPILEKSITENPLSIDFIDTIWSKSIKSTVKNKLQDQIKVTLIKPNINT